MFFGARLLSLFDCHFQELPLLGVKTVHALDGHGSSLRGRVGAEAETFRRLAKAVTSELTSLGDRIHVDLGRNNLSKPRMSS